ncbi:MAG: TIGR03619 family F420-dependent LLM class oxidoreductase [Myxococcota bacterium]|nr:TIGR03619 family F420-dependent LLM class oxidoreductase [Myxococcota bacterium]
MKIGVAVRSMGEASRKETLLAAVRWAESAGIDDIWLQDHLAIPPDDAEGSQGRYLDPLTTLAWLAGKTERIGLGAGVLVLPYRRALPTAKSIATVQELSEGRLLLGVGVGWMQAEFNALGISRAHRGRDTDRVLDLMRRAFSAPDDVIEEHGQKLLFRPKPAAPPIYIGGKGLHALKRTVRYGDGWMPMGADPAQLKPEIEKLAELAEAAGRPCPDVVCLGGLPLDDVASARDQLRSLSEIGVTHFVAGGGRYTSLEEFKPLVDGVSAIRTALG